MSKIVSETKFFFQILHHPLSKMSKIMLDFISIFSKGGILLWCFKGSSLFGRKGGILLWCFKGSSLFGRKGGILLWCFKGSSLFGRN